MGTVLSSICVPASIPNLDNIDIPDVVSSFLGVKEPTFDPKVEQRVNEVIKMKKVIIVTNSKEYLACEMIKALMEKYRLIIDYHYSVWEIDKEENSFDLQRYIDSYISKKLPIVFIDGELCGDCEEVCT